MGLTETLRSLRGLAPTKHFESSFQMRVLPLASLLFRPSRDVLNFREHWGQHGRVSQPLCPW